MNQPEKPIYSPSQTKTWQQCPILRQLERQGYRPTTYGKKEIAAAMGRGLAAGLSWHYTIRRNSISPQEHSPNQIADRILTAELASLIAAGRVCDNRDIELLDQASPKLQRILNKILGSRASSAVNESMWLAGDPIPDDWTIEDVELSLADHGNARLDLGVRDPHNLAVLDWKLKLSLPKGYKRDMTIREYAHDWQMFHYCWAYSEVKEQPVTRFYIGLVVLEPTFSVELIPYEVEPEALQMWKVSARQVWDDMAKEEAGERIPYQAAVHFDRYGMCSMYKACFTHKYHEHLMLAGDYVKEDN